MIPYKERKSKKEARQSLCNHPKTAVCNYTVLMEWTMSLVVRFQYSHCWLMFTVKEGLLEATLALHEYLEYGLM